MLQTKRRPFTDAEREQVEQELLNRIKEPRPDYAGAVGVAALCAFFGLVVGGFVAAILAVLELPRFWAGMAVGVGTGVGFALGWRDQRRTEERAARDRKANAGVLANRLQHGEMEEITVTASGVVEAWFDEDDGSHYFFDIGNDRVLFLYGDTLWSNEEALDYGVDDKPVLPSAFRMYRYPDMPEEVLSLVVLGPSLTPSDSVPLIPQEGFYDTYKNLAVFENVRLATLAKDLPFVVDEDDAS